MTKDMMRFPNLIKIIRTRSVYHRCLLGHGVEIGTPNWASGYYWAWISLRWVLPAFPTCPKWPGSGLWSTCASSRPWGWDQEPKLDIYQLMEFSRSPWQWRSVSRSRLLSRLLFTLVMTASLGGTSHSCDTSTWFWFVLLWQQWNRKYLCFQLPLLQMRRDDASTSVVPGVATKMMVMRRGVGEKECLKA